MTSASETKRLLESARKRLVETGTRNRLVHINRQAKRSNSLTIIDENAGHVFETLRLKNKKMKFYPTQSEPVEEELPNGTADELLAPQTAFSVDQNAIAPPNSASRSLTSNVDPQVMEVSETVDQQLEREARKTDNVLDTPQTPTALHKRLLKLFRDARTAEEEQGVNVLYLAIGFLQWFEAKSSSILRESPLILLPVELVRNGRSSTYDIRCRDDDIVTNLPLQERLRADFGIELPEIDDGSDWKPRDYFDAVRESIKSQQRWDLDEDGMQLGFFSFAKLLMLRDLDPDNWPADALMHSDLIGRLLGEGFEYEPPLFPDGANLDKLLDPAEQLQVVDADASQVKVIEEVRSGRNLVVQGPPGTGKSQTITNILATAAHDGKRVLFVAEKMAALKVVYSRMQGVGLGDLCLELHSKAANKRAVLNELKLTLSRAGSAEASSDNCDELRATRNALNGIGDLLHKPFSEGSETPFEAIADIVGFIGQGHAAPRLQASWLASQSEADLERRVLRVANFVSAMEAVVDENSHPFNGAQNLDLQPVDLQRLLDELDEALIACRTLNELSSTILNGLDVDQAPSFSEIESLVDLLEHASRAPENMAEEVEFLSQYEANARFKYALAAGAAWQDIHHETADEFVDAAYDFPIKSMRGDLTKGLTSFWARTSGKYRGASTELSSLLIGDLPKTPTARVQLVDKLHTAQKALKAFEDDEDYLKAQLAERWLGKRQTELSRLNECLNWMTNSSLKGVQLSARSLSTLLRLSEAQPQLFAELRAASAETQEKVSRPFDRLELSFANAGPSLSKVSLRQLIARLHQLTDQQHRYAEWVILQKSKDQCAADGLDGLLNLVSTGAIGADQAESELRFASAEARWGVARQKRPELEKLQQLDRHKLVETFKILDQAHTKDSQNKIRCGHLASLPVGAVGEMAYLRGEMAKKTRHRPIRLSMTSAGRMVQRIKPVMMMSPISVAQFLPPGKIEFDLLVIDEASQVRPEDALGAVARSKQIVVVGDQKQLPPTNFFSRLAESTDDDLEVDEEAVSVKAEQMESILTLCDARGLKSSMLQYHYRSKDPSLIAVSNLEFYDNRLLMPPSPVESGEVSGLSFQQVPGVYTPQGFAGAQAGTNRIEAQAVVSALVRHAESDSEQSIGIVTFSKRQADMVTEVIEQARRQNTKLDEFLAKRVREDVFVKNIENVQGDERDIILVSVGYGPTVANGRLSSMRFGPINTDGGERRLNVLFTRSRMACRIFASFDPAEIDLNRTGSNGARVLKRFLEFAKSGILEEKLESGEDADSPFEEDVARVIQRLGYPVDLQVGTSGFRIDLGVRHPERSGMYILAVECDGATYHSSIWARERDRQRQEILEGFGWKFHRIWSTDWFHNRTQEITRLTNALELAYSSAAVPETSAGANSGVIDWGEEPTEEDQGEQLIELSNLEVPADAYVRFHKRWSAAVELHELPIQTMSGCVVEIVEFEGPIHSEEVGRRVASGFGRAKAGSRIQEAVARGLRHAIRNGKLESDGEFWFTNEQKMKAKPRNRSQENTTTTKAEYLSDLEIWAAAELLELNSGHMEEVELVRAISRLLGYKRSGPDFQARVSSSLRNRPKVTRI